jgi:GntR family transcriptional regulator, rspAB operon transcriptional repressor
MEEIVRGLRIQIVERIREDIMSGRLTGGQRLSELALGRRFGVSRGPIREALVQLAQEGLVDRKPNCGVHVSMPVPDSIRAVIVPIRRTIETFALQSIFDELTEDDFRRWEAILKRMAKACQEMDPGAAVEQDIAFHRLLLERAGQPDLLAIWSTIVARVRGHFRQVHLARRDQPIDVHADHQQLIEAFRSGDREVALQTWEAHIA